MVERKCQIQNQIKKKWPILLKPGQKPKIVTGQFIIGLAFTRISNESDDIEEVENLDENVNDRQEDVDDNINNDITNVMSNYNSDSINSNINDNINNVNNNNNFDIEMTPGVEALFCGKCDYQFKKDEPYMKCCECEGINLCKDCYDEVSNNSYILKSVKGHKKTHVFSEQIF